MNRQVEIIGVPLDFGAGVRGTRFGPHRMREGGLVAALAGLGHDVVDRGDVEVPSHDASHEGDPRLRFLEPIAAVTAKLCQLTAAALTEGRFPLVVGGDHSLALGSIRGAAFGRRLGVIWIDAHADFNTVETSPSGNIHGMPLAALTGLGDARLVGVGGRGHPPRAIDPASIALLGVRSIDAGERELLQREGVVNTAEFGFEEAVARAIAIASHGTDGIYLSVDLDAVDPRFAPGVSSPEPNGLTPAQVLFACEAVRVTGKLVGMDIVELNPLTDVDGLTARLSREIAMTALGRGEPSLGLAEGSPRPIAATDMQDSAVRAMARTSAG